MEKRLLMMINKTIMGKASQAHRFCVLAFRLALFMRILLAGSCLCFVMVNMVKYNVMKKNVAVLENTVEKHEQELAANVASRG